MFRFDADVKVYVHRDAIDFRKSIAGLATIVEQALGLDPQQEMHDQLNRPLPLSKGKVIRQLF